jgi:hypothetical protein
MKKTILALVMVLMAAFAVQEVQAAPVKPVNPVKQAVQFKSDSVMASTAEEMEKVREKINEALDDTLTTGSMGSIGIGGENDLTAEDMLQMSAQWAEVVKKMGYASIAGLLALVLLVLLFRYLNRRNKYRVMERAIENNYPLNDLSFNDAKRSAIYVQQPVIRAAVPQQPGQVPVGTPIQGQTPDNPIVVSNVFNWRALMPGIRVFGWGLFLLLFGIFVAGGNDPFTVVGVALMVVGLIKGFILYKEQQSLQEAMKHAQQTQPRQSMREGIPVPPPLDDDYKEDDNNPYQPY